MLVGKNWRKEKKNKNKIENDHTSRPKSSIYKFYNNSFAFLKVVVAWEPPCGVRCWARLFSSARKGNPATLPSSIVILPSKPVKTSEDPSTRTTRDSGYQILVLSDDLPLKTRGYGKISPETPQFQLFGGQIPRSPQ
jgi:hypothetical protein